MKKVLLAVVALCAIAAPALAADLPARVYTKAPMAPAQPILYAWTGLYIGGHIGGAFSGNNNAFGGSGNDGRFLGGGQVGADYQFSGNYVIGIEGNYSYLDNSNNNAFLFPGGSFNHNLRGLASVTGRLGYTWGPALLYFKGGYAYADTSNNGFGAFSANNNRDGYTLGGGLEYMFAQNWSAKLEYQYYRFDNNQLLVGTPLLLVGNFRDEEHTIKLGLNYRFNLAGPLAPVY
jgi:outer membrane immunogenic protein